MGPVSKANSTNVRVSFGESIWNWLSDVTVGEIETPSFTEEEESTLEEELFLRDTREARLGR